MPDAIREIQAREIISALGRPTVEVLLRTESGIRSTASVPSGTSKGQYEAHELVDGGSRYRGYGVRKAVDNVNQSIFAALKGMEVTQQMEIDQVLIDLDGTQNKSRLGGNAIMPVSVACAKAGAMVLGVPTYRYLDEKNDMCLPVPMATVIAGGMHSPSDLDFEDYLYIFDGFESFHQAVEAMVESRLSLGSLLVERFGPQPEDGGALAPPIGDTRQAFDIMLEAIERSGLSGKISLGVDVAANELYRKDEDVYHVGGRAKDADEMCRDYIQLASEYPITYIEDPFYEDDFKTFSGLTSALPDIRIVGDDLYASNPSRVQQGVKERATSGLLLKINQIGTVSEACQAAQTARSNRMSITVSVRSRETNDDFAADLSVANGAEQIKTGAPIRGERLAKINRLLEIETQSSGEIPFAGYTIRP